MSTPTRPVLRYHGGKWKLAPWIISHFPAHRAYVEPFGGGASVLLRKPRVPTEVWNDLDGELVHLFKVLRDPSSVEALSRSCALTPFAREEFDLSYEETEDQVERARRFIVRSFFGYGSKACISHAKNGFRCLRTGENSPAVDWSRYPEALQAAARRMLGVVIEHKPALDIIRRFDRQDTLFYLDPPYVQGLRNLEQGIYRHEMTDDEHRELAASLLEIKGMAVVSGYRCALYDELYSGWRRLDCRAYADKASPRTESLWISPKAQAATQGKLLEVV
ncbi:MAG: DNA adenine methylase [Proteobacteria bacterium]|nr:DNA adenine methylase [Pseudomonadota bacterium]MBU1594247.1 DNA adenine methylase [Pseudomonadota bacterium]